MRRFHCGCGAEVFYENTLCGNCGGLLGFEPVGFTMLRARAGADSLLYADDGRSFHYCVNGRDYATCNWLLGADTGLSWCLSCSLNETIPTLDQPGRLEWWAELESAKRRLLYTLLDLGLPVVARAGDADGGFGFAFLEDRRSNPTVELEHVLTGYASGLITVNLLEAHSPSRELARVNLGEQYRTLLGHFRHEVGHYYFEQLVAGTALHGEFRALFGDESADYAAALQAYYRQDPDAAWDESFISRYAQAHPLEDWAEVWAHYLHMYDTLQTAEQYGLATVTQGSDFDTRWQQWAQVTVALNELNRSMGLRDAYPFIMSDATLRKLRFVHRLIGPRKTPMQ